MSAPHGGLAALRAGPAGASQMWSLGRKDLSS
jgi:hypothetical protein